MNSPPHGVRRLGLFGCICSLLLLMGSLPSLAHAAKPSPDSAWRDTLWITGSGALLGAALSGMYALKADALRDRAQGMYLDSPELPGLSRDADRATALAIGFGAGGALFTVASLLVLALGPSDSAAPSGDAPRAVLTPVVGPGTAGLSWRGSLP